MDVTPNLNTNMTGRLFLIPSSTKPGQITRVLREGYDAERLTKGLRALLVELELDVLYMTTRVPDGDSARGTTLGLNAQAGFMGFLGKTWVYRVSGSYLGAIVPGTGDDLGGLVLQAGIGKFFDD